MNRGLLLCGVLTISLVSCYDEEVRRSEGNFPYHVDNYWIYRQKSTYPDGTVVFSSYLDSVRIVKDTLINNKLYKLQYGTQSGSQYVRDSADCVISGRLVFEEIIYSTSRDTLFRSTQARKVNTETNTMTIVPAGKFKTNTCNTLVKIDPLNPVHHGWPIYNNKFYSSEQYISNGKIGLIKHVYYSFGVIHEIELVEYSLN